MFPPWLRLVARGTLAEGLAFPISYNILEALFVGSPGENILLFVELPSAPNANLHTENEVMFIVDKKKNQEKAITKFSSHVFESPTFKGSNNIW